MALTCATKLFKYFNLNQCVRCVSINLYTRRTKTNQFISHVNNKSVLKVSERFFCNDTSLPGVDPFAAPKVKRKKTVEVPKIVLYDEHGHKSVLPLEEAEKLAKSRHLKLFQMSPPTNTQKATYKLTSPAHYLTDDLDEKPHTASKQSEMSKEVKKKKMILISGKITDYDLENKIRNIKRALIKKHEVHVNIGNEGGEQGISKIAKGIEKGVKGYGILNKKVTPKSTKFNIQPVDEIVVEIPPEEESIEQKQNN